MKCPKCSGKGMVDYPMYADDEHKWQYCVARMKKCDMCNGTGEVPMTNEEYLRSCTTEQLAEFLADKYNEAVDWILYEVDEHAGNIEPDDYWYRQDVVAEWLKQPHTPKE